MEDRKIVHLIKRLKKYEPAILVEFDKSKIEESLYKFHIFDPKVSGKKGFGASFDLVTAFEKARSEYFERKIFLEYARKKDSNVWSSSGFSCHISRNDAERSSFCELIERDSFLMSWLSRTPPVWLENDLIKQQVPMFDPSLFLRSNVEIKLGFVAKVGDVFVAVSCSVFENDADGMARIAIDTSANHCLKLALQSVYIGSLIRVESYLYSDRRKHVESESPIFHFFKHADNQLQSGWFINGSDRILEYDAPTVNFKNWTLDVADTKLFVAYCDANVQKYFTGKTTDEKINISRLNLLTGITYHEINREFHPLP